MEGTAKPEYGRCVDIVTKAALQEMAIPGFISIFMPLLVGFFLGPKALAGFLIGLIAVGFMHALMMDNEGSLG
jgi:K(+)-stimulated pyrophosphate-energized sodium pump